jgi:DNA-binding IclR family transcriptional regulator
MASDANRTLEKGLDMLFQFTEKNPVMSVKDIVAELDLPRSTAYRLLDTLKSKQLIQEHGPGRYRLGLSILQLSKVATAGMDLIQLVTPMMEELSEETGETIILSGLFGDHAICIDRIESLKPIKLTFERGRILPLHLGASAKILLAYMEEEAKKKVIQRVHENGYILDVEDYKQKLITIKDQGFVISNEEVDPGAWAAAIPIFNASGDILAGISVAAPKYRIDAEKEKKIVDRLLICAADLNNKMKLMEIVSI